MIDNRTDREVERDAAQAEHDAVDAEQAAERAAELAHEQLVADLVGRLLDLGSDAHTAAADSVARLLDEVALRQPPNVHRYALLARRQHLALLAATVANDLDDYRGYDLAERAQLNVDAYLARHTVGTGPHLNLDGPLREAVAEVIATVAAAIAAAR